MKDNKCNLKRRKWIKPQIKSNKIKDSVLPLGCGKENPSIPQSWCECDIEGAPQVT